MRGNVRRVGSAESRRALMRTRRAPRAARFHARTLLAGQAVRRLARLQGAGGGWSDFHAKPGTSTSWVTAYVTVALALAARRPDLPAGSRRTAWASARAGGKSLLVQARHGSWGWSPGVRPDADSTAWAALALRLVGLPASPATWDFLARHATSSGYRTFSEASLGVWAEPSPEVTAIVTRALFPGTARVSSGDGRPTWTSASVSPWWPDAAHAAALVATLDPRLVTWSPGSLPQTAAGLADELWLRALTGRGHAEPVVAALRAIGPPWPGDTRLRIPPQHGEGPSRIVVDARGVYTTATILHAALAVGPRRSTPSKPGCASNPPRSLSSSKGATPARPRDSRWDHFVWAAAVAQGVSPTRALTVFGDLTRESLGPFRPDRAPRSPSTDTAAADETLRPIRRPAPWPSAQLSTLAAGLPVEFSAASHPSVRFTCEVGDPTLIPPDRLRAGLGALRRTAARLGVTQSLDRARAVLEILADPAQPVGEGCRFWLWAGVDLQPDGSGKPDVLKAYLSLHAGVVDDWRARLNRALADLPASGTVWPALDALDGAGWGHEVGIGLGPRGRWALKIYYELDRWRPDVLARVAAAAGLASDLGALAPDVPGVVRGTRGRRRFGIAFRVDPATGNVVDLTTACAFPEALVGRDALNARVLRWLGHDSVAATLLLEALDAAPSPPPRAERNFTAAKPGDFHLTPSRRAPTASARLSLFTRTIGAGRPRNAIYVRAAPRD